MLKHPLTGRNSSSPIKGVVFDLDGTLLDTETLSDLAMIQSLRIQEPLLSKLGGRLPWDLKSRILGMRGSEWSPIVVQYFLTNYDVGNGDAGNDVISPAKLWGTWEKTLSDLCENVRPLKGAKALVRAFKEVGMPMAIATSSQMAAVESKRIRHEDMFSAMSVIVTGDDPAVRSGKPAPDIFLEAASRMGVDPKNCLVFEDSMTGVMSGKAAGCQVVAVPDSRCNKVAFLEVADVVINNLTYFDASRFGIEGVDIKSQTARVRRGSRRD